MQKLLSKTILVSTLLLSIALGLTGCSKKMELPGMWTFRLLSNPEAYVRGEGMPKFEDLIGEMTLEPPLVMGDWRKGFMWDWSSPLIFDVKLLKDSVIAFEYGFSDKAFKLKRDYSFKVKVVQKNLEVIVTNASGSITRSKNGSAWTSEKKALDEFKPGPARIVFELHPPSGLPAEEHFLLANPRIYSIPKDKPKHVILIAVDTLRADHLSCYGYRRKTSPVIDKWAESGTIYEYCISASPWTFPSFGSMLTGKFPSVAGSTTNVRYLPDSELTIAEAFSGVGYSTYSIVNSAWVGKPTNLHQGFDGAVQLSTGRSQRAFIYVTEWLEAHADENTFLFVHMMDPHLPYNPPAEFNSKFDPAYKGRFKTTFGGEMIDPIRSGEAQLTTAEKKHLVALYDGEINYFDREFGKFLSFLDDKEMRNDTLIVLTSDHGEEFFEHGGFEHGHSLFDEVIHVPLIISGLGYPGGKRVSDHSSTVDIFPTLADHLGLPATHGLNGKSLIGGDDITDRLLVTEQLLYGEELKGVTTSDYRYIYHTVSGDEELYDLAEDIRMLESVSADRKAKSREFRGFVTSYIVGKGTPWHLLFMRGGGRGDVTRYSGTITASGGFADIRKSHFMDDDAADVDGETITFSLMIGPSMEKEISFVTIDESADVHFEIFEDDLPLDGGRIFIGPELDPNPDAIFTLSVNDERFNLGQPNLRRKLHDGGFIWAIPARLREQFAPDLTPAMEEELRSIGYFN